MTLAVTPELLAAELIADAIPASVLLVESTLIDVVEPPTAIVKVPVPTVEFALAMGCEVRLAEVARLFTCREYWPATATEDAVAEAMVLSATVASNPASVPGVSSGPSAACNVSSALVKE